MLDETSMVEEFDRDEAVAEAMAGLAESTRGDLFRRTGMIAGLGLAATLLPAGVASARRTGTKANDVKILNFALTLEYLEAAFYAEANARGNFASPTVRRFSQVVGGHEAAHVVALRNALGAKAISSPSFDFKGTTRGQKTFLRTAMLLEDTGVSAYQGQAPLIHQNAVLAPAGAILAVEARHAAWVRNLLGNGKTVKPAPLAFNKALTRAQVLAAVKKTGFIKS